MDINQLIEHLGFGTFQRKLLIRLWSAWFIDGVELTLIAVIGPTLKCVWNISSFITALTSTTIFLGMGLGSLMWGWLGDKHGRVKIIWISLAITCYFGFLSAASTNVYWFMTTRAFVGIGTAGILATPALITEYISTKYRAKCVFLCQLPFALGSIFVSVVAYFTLNSYGWQTFLIICSLPVPFILLNSFFVPESVRYLLTVGDWETLMKILNHISIENKKKLPEKLNFGFSASSDTRGSLSLLFKNYRLQTLIFMVMWIASLNSYYAFVMLNSQFASSGFCRYEKTLEFNTTAECHFLTKQDLLQSMFIGIGELLGVITALTMVNALGRKKMVILCSCLPVISLLLINFCFGYYVTTLLFLLGRMGVAIMSINIWIFSAEAFPTVVRATALGLFGLVARVFTGFSPLIVQYLMTISPVAVIVVLIFLLFVCIICALCLEETAEKKVKDF